MEFLFPISGVEVNVLIPPLVAMAISFVASMGGLSGAFLLLPFQMSFLGYTAPSVSGTNHVYNIAAIPSGVYRYIKEGRMVWPLAWVVIAGSVPGALLGYYARVLYLPDPENFKVFAGIVLLYMGYRLLNDFFRPNRPKNSEAASVDADDMRVETSHLSLTKVEYIYRGEKFSFNTMVLLALSLCVGTVGGAYGIGGGAIIAPFCVSVFGLPVHTIAGAALMGTFITSLAGALFFSFIPTAPSIYASPDWALGILFGAGGFAGMYLGAGCQKYVPEKIIKLTLGVIICGVAMVYIVPVLF